MKRVADLLKKETGKTVRIDPVNHMFDQLRAACGPRTSGALPQIGPSFDLPQPINAATDVKPVRSWRQSVHRTVLIASGQIVVIGLILVALSKIDDKFAGGIALWAGVFAATYVKKRGWLWFFVGTILGLLAVVFASIVGALYRGLAI